MSTALIVLDPQKIYTDSESELYCQDANVVISNINQLIDKFEQTKKTIVLVRHEHKSDGTDIGHLFDFDGEAEEDFNFKEGTREVEFDADLRIPSQSIQIVKNRYSAFAGTQLASQLKMKGIDTVVVCGFMTNFCCASTARQALDEDFYVVFLPDATGTPGTDNMNQEKVREVTSDLLGAGFAQISSTADYLKRINS